jgi:hypothetical protein
MNDAISLLIGGAWLFLGLLIGLVGAAGGVLWIRLLSYRISPSHLELLLLGYRVRRVPLSDIVSAERIDDRGNSWISCLWSLVSGTVRPWKVGGFLSSERWGNKFCGPFVLVRRRRGRSIALTPADPNAFIRDLLAAAGR